MAVVASLLVPAVARGQAAVAESNDPDAGFVAALALLASATASTSVGLARADWERTPNDDVGRAFDRGPVIGSGTIGLVSLATLGAIGADADLVPARPTPTQVVGQCLATIGTGALAGGAVLPAHSDRAMLAGGLTMLAGTTAMAVGIPLWFERRTPTRKSPGGPLGPPPPEILIGPLGAVLRWKF